MGDFNSVGFDADGMCIVKLTDWLDAASREGRQEGDFPMIVLPMIQRGSVWKPHQVMDLWDTLLRGLPVGSMIAGWAKPGEYFTPIKRELRKVEKGEILSLVDGQQRTLSMLTGWPGVNDEMSRRIWVDLGDDDKHDHLFRFHFTSEFQPFGFELAGPSGSAVGKLSRDNRRRALAFFEAVHGDLPDKASEFEKRRQLLWAHSAPWHGVVPVNLQEVLKCQNSLTDLFEERREHVLGDLEKALKHFRSLAADDMAKTISTKIDRLERIDEKSRIERLEGAVAAFRKLNMPLIQVPETAFVSDDTDDRDPVLAVLFQRISTGGTALTNADYVYSILKHHIPECHGLVEAMLNDDPAVAALFDPVSLVSSAVRLTAARMGAHDHARIDKGQFAKLKQVPGFAEKFKADIAPNGSFSKGLRRILADLGYRDSGDVGFPRQALRLIKLPVLEVLLFWFLVCGRESLDYGNRLRLIRFALYCRFGITGDHARASERMFEEIKRLRNIGGMPDFPETELLRVLEEKRLALPMRSPDDYRGDAVLEQVVFCPEPLNGSNKILRGEARFSIPDQALDESQKNAIELYRRFCEPWTHRHEMLLWLQREYVSAKFEKSPALPGSEDEIPYDYDHICPQNHWGDWTGSREGEGRLIDYRRDASAEAILGNSIGNVRVWDSSDNRSDGDASVVSKMAGNGGKDCPMTLSLVSGNEYEMNAWLDCSGDGYERPRHWDAKRAIAFQRAIEHRTFNLFQRFHADLQFSEYELSE